MNQPIRTKPARRGPPAIGRFTTAALAQLAQKTRFVDPNLAAEWPTIVGPDLAALARPGRLTGSRVGRTLELFATSGAGATELNQRAGELVERLNARLGPGVVAHIKIVQGGGVAPDGGGLSRFRAG